MLGVKDTRSGTEGPKVRRPHEGPIAPGPVSVGPSTPSGVGRSAGPCDRPVGPWSPPSLGRWAEARRVRGPYSPNSFRMKPTCSGLAVASHLLELHGGAVEQLVHDRSRGGVDGAFLFGGERAEAPPGFLDLGPADLVGALAQIDEQRHHVERAAPLEERADLLLDDAFRGGSFPLPLAEVRLGDRLHVVEVVEEDAGHLPGVLGDVARHGDVDEEERPPAARGLRRLDVVAVNDHARGPGAADDDVGLRELAAEGLERGRRARRAQPRAVRPSRRSARRARWRARRRAPSAARRARSSFPRRRAGRRGRAARRRSCARARRRRARPRRRCARWRSRSAPASPRAIDRLRSAVSTDPRLPAFSAAAYASFTWPRICGSPITIESRLAATRNAWRTAASPSRR